MWHLVFQGKIPDESRAFVRIAQKYRGIRKSEIMGSCGFSWYTIYMTLKGVKDSAKKSRARQKEISRATSEIERRSQEGRKGRQ